MRVIIVGLVQTILLVIAAIIVATALKVSFGEVPSAILKFAAAALASGAIATLIPVGGIVALFIFLGLIMWLFELEITYAIAVTFVYFLASFGVGFALRS